MGIVFFVFSSGVKSVSVEYDEDCPFDLEECEVEIKIEESMEGPIYFYYSLENFFQNHFDYITSVDYEQLHGTHKDAKDLSSCEPIVKAGDMPYSVIKLNGDKMGASEPMYPCGLIATTMFNGTCISTVGHFT